MSITYNSKNISNSYIVHANFNDEINLRANDNDSYRFSHWESNVSTFQNPSISTIETVIKSATSIKAVFLPNDVVKLDGVVVPAQAGWISGIGTYEYNLNIQLLHMQIQVMNLFVGKVKIFLTSI